MTETPNICGSDLLRLVPAAFFVAGKTVPFCADTMGLHRVENSSHTNPAVSLHLYSPPFQTCQSFDQRTGRARAVRMTFWSEYGRRTLPAVANANASATSTTAAAAAAEPRKPAVSRAYLLTFYLRLCDGHNCTIRLRFDWRCSTARATTYRRSLRRR